MSDPHIMSPAPSMKYARPMVAMNRMTGSWFTRCLSTTRSTNMAKTSITTNVQAMAKIDGMVQPKPCSSVPKIALISSANGICPFWNPTSVSAAKRAMTPCA